MITTWLRYGFISLLLMAMIACDDNQGVNFPNLYGTSWKCKDVTHLPEVASFVLKFSSSVQVDAFTLSKSNEKALSWSGVYYVNKGNITIDRPGAEKITGQVEGSRMNLWIDGKNYPFSKE